MIAVEIVTTELATRRQTGASKTNVKPDDAGSRAVETLGLREAVGIDEVAESRRDEELGHQQRVTGATRDDD